MSADGAPATVSPAPATGAAADPGDKPDRQVADMAGPSALPRKNGELVFESAWAARLFGMTVALNQGQRFHWNQFRDRLIDEIAAAERHGIDSSYYTRWFAAFERVLAEVGLLTPAELEARAAEFTCGQRNDVF